jgi:conjugative relaxase-like TrwC/TraI family protein
MLSIVALKNANAAKSYYEKDNYYVKDSPETLEASHWFGKGAKMLGISGYVELEKFEPLLEGTLPNSEQLGRFQDGKIKHRPGYDLTF